MQTADLRQWIDRREVMAAVLTPVPAAALAATLDRDASEPAAGALLPPLWHWLYATPVERQSELDVDGHVRRGGFVPPIALPRRMWAGGRLEYHHPLRIGEHIVRTSRITAIREVEGRSGPLVFVTVLHETANQLGVALSEEHDIVYRDMPRAGQVSQPKHAPTDETFAREIVPDPVLLFRYSALTFNGHRIHYDRPYATETEGYPGLLVHGPLIATLLADLARRQRPDATVRRFEFKALHPLFDIHRFHVCGRDTGTHASDLWARDHEGHLAMQARIEYLENAGAASAD
ncbi:MAG: FAS1-like dehydratase domain-containing protein [Janthinobacterium lividum]